MNSLKVVHETRSRMMLHSKPWGWRQYCCWSNFFMGCRRLLRGTPCLQQKMLCMRRKGRLSEFVVNSLYTQLLQALWLHSRHFMLATFSALQITHVSSASGVGYVLFSLSLFAFNSGYFKSSNSSMVISPLLENALYEMIKRMPVRCRALRQVGKRKY